MYFRNIFLNLILNLDRKSCPNFLVHLSFLLEEYFRSWREIEVEKKVA